MGIGIQKKNELTLIRHFYTIATRETLSVTLDEKNENQQDTISKYTAQCIVVYQLHHVIGTKLIMSPSIRRRTDTATGLSLKSA